MRKIILVFGILVIVIIICYGYWSRPIDVSYDCINYILGEDDVKFVPVTITGTVHYSILREDYIDYYLIIDGIRIPNVSESEYILPYDFSGVYQNSNGDITVNWRDTIQNNLRVYDNYARTDISYFIVSDTEPVTNYRTNFGGIYFSKDFSDIIIIKSIPDESGSHWSTEDGNEVIVSRSTIAEAEELAIELNDMYLGNQ